MRLFFRNFLIAISFCFLGVLAGSVQAQSEEISWKFLLEREISRVQQEFEPAREMDFIILSGKPEINEEDIRILSRYLDHAGLSTTEDGRAAVARFYSRLGLPDLFHAYPVTIERKTKNEYVCVLKLDFETRYDLPMLLRALHIEARGLDAAGIDLTRISIERLQLHIIRHELWHCLDILQWSQLTHFAAANVEPLNRLSANLLQSVLRNFAETGADTFATLLDFRDHSDWEMARLLIHARVRNFEQRRDLDHYTVPALNTLPATIPPPENRQTISEWVTLTNRIREYALSIAELQRMARSMQ